MGAVRRWKGRNSWRVGWEQIEQGLWAREYARRVCQELGWPYRDNLTLLLECIESFACLKGLDVWGGFSGIMLAVEYAKRTGILKERGRWFFTDGDYAGISRRKNWRRPKKVEPLDEIDLEIPALGRVFHGTGKTQLMCIGKIRYHTMRGAMKVAGGGRQHDTMNEKLRRELDEAERKAIDALGRYKFQMFGYWAAIWVHPTASAA